MIRFQKNEESLEMLTCPVCTEYKPNLYDIADCGHRFCQFCCIAYIQSQASSFNQAKCLQENCSAELNKSKYIYSRLSKETISKMAKFQKFDFLQKKTDAKICKIQQCSGYFLKTDKKGLCIICNAEHCHRCYQIKHQGACITSKQEQQMRELHYRNCPRCNIWVQKIDGCQYISCKCGIQFCYKCGAQFSKDPCRKQSLWQQQLAFRTLLSQLQFPPPSTLKQIFLTIPRFLLSLSLILPFTTVFCILPLVITLNIFGLLIFILSPLILGYPISMLVNKKQKYLAFLALIIFYPVVGSLFTCLFFIIILLYPFLRQKYHYGVYDPIDLIVSKFAVWYLKFIILTLKCSGLCC